jgi:hypothetical protein
LAAVVPSMVFIASVRVADSLTDSPTSMRWSGAPGDVLSTLTYLLLFISGPASIPLAFVRSRGPLLWVGALFTVLSVVAAVLVITTDDAQAGMSVFIVAMFGVPIALFGLVCSRLYQSALARETGPQLG